MFLLKDILLNTYCRFINIELMANSTIIRALKQLLYKAYLRHVFPLLHKAHDSLSSQALDSTAALSFGAMLNSKTRHRTGGNKDPWLQHEN